MTFYTKKEVADYLRVHPRTVERWLMQQQLKGYKLGRGKTSLWRISKTALMTFLKTKAMSSTNAPKRRNKGK